MLKTRVWVLGALILAAILGLLTWLTLGRSRESSVVQVVQDGAVLKEIDLSAVTEEYSFTVEWPEGGSNTVTVQPGRIRVSGADCPDQTCVRQGWLADRAAPVVCLPHRLVLRWKTVSGETDAIAK